MILKFYGVGYSNTTKALFFLLLVLLSLVKRNISAASGYTVTRATVTGSTVST